jgi:glycosyltransferase involved in cell wall biosynthesis
MNETNAGGVRQRSVEIVVPVHNEAHVLAESIGRLHAYLEESFPFPFRITVADNASTDATWQEATDLSLRLPHVHAVHLKAGLAARFTDAQCGFKAIRTDVFRALAPHIEDTAWFFDTELLVLAQRNRLRIHEVPVARTTTPAVQPTGANNHLEYAS